MNLHPLLVSIVVVDGLGLLALALAVPTAVRVVLSWKPGDSGAGQLSLERDAERASAYARLGLALHAGGLVLLLVAINHVLPAIVPGAMCGYGALQAMPDGTVVLLARAISIAALIAWLEVDRADRATPTGSLAAASSRALLVAAPLAAVSVGQSLDALAHVDVQTPVSCCAAVFDLARSQGTQGSLPFAGTAGTTATAAGAVLIAAAAVALRRRARRDRLQAAALALLGVVSAAWVVIGVWTLIDVGAPYVYGVLGHRCPFCLMLPVHGAVGYVAYGAAAVTIVESLRCAVASRIGSRPGADGSLAFRTLRAGLLRIAVSTLVFALVSLGPALVWRIRYGVWLTG